MSHEAIRTQLTSGFEKFTDKETDYAIQHFDQ